MEKTVILYIDDSGVERKIVRQLLEAEGFQVLTAGKPEEGIEMAREIKPHLVLLDLHLPEMNGCAVADRLREIPHMHKVPIVALSASIKEEEREEVLRKFDGYIQKPVDVDLFPRMVYEFMNQGKGLGEEKIHERAKEATSKSQPAAETLEVLETLERVRAAMSHDLRTPLTVMISYASTVGREKVGELTDRQKEMLELVVNHGFQMDAIISELVRMAKETLQRFNYPPK